MIELTEPQKKWIAALRSGEYKQTRGKLKNPDGHCCLGVACEIFREELDLEEEPVVFLDDGEEYTMFNGQKKLPPAEVVEHLDLYSEDGKHRSCNHLLRLWMLNDVRQLSFAEIADRIETGEYFKPVEGT